MDQWFAKVLPYEKQSPKPWTTSKNRIVYERASRFTKIFQQQVATKLRESGVAVDWLESSQSRDIAIACVMDLWDRLVDNRESKRGKKQSSSSITEDIGRKMITFDAIGGWKLTDHQAGERVPVKITGMTRYDGVAIYF